MVKKKISKVQKRCLLHRCVLNFWVSLFPKPQRVKRSLLMMMTTMKITRTTKTKVVRAMTMKSLEKVKLRPISLSISNKKTLRNRMKLRKLKQEQEVSKKTLFDSYAFTSIH